jgi:hypothetical protein
MTDRDLGALLERASEHLPEVDFADGAWSAALAERRRRRRVATGAAGAVAAAGLAVTAVQLGGAPTPKPVPAVSTTVQADRGTLSDGTPYAMMPLEGKEGTLRHFDSGLPSVIDLRAQVTRLSEGSPPGSVVAVYLEPDGEVFHPVLVAGDGTQVVADRVSLVRTTDADGNAAPPLGPRAFGGGRYVVFPQPGKVVRLDVQTGATVGYPVPSQHLEHAGWAADNGTIVARAADHAWTIDPWRPGARAHPADGTFEGLFRLDADQQGAGANLLVSRQDGQRPSVAGRVPAPVFEVGGETLNTEERAATSAFFDQEVTSRVIRRGNGPIYQGLVAVDVGAAGSAARVLLAPENPDGQTGRFKGCCTVLGWADGRTVLFQSVGSHGAWVLAWNVETGEVFETARITADPAGEQVPTLALNVGWRY